MPKLKLFLLSLLVVFGSTSANHLPLRLLRGGEEIRELELEDGSEGRSVRNGLAALGGYTLGLSKALVGVFIYDVITANVSSTEARVALRPLSPSELRRALIEAGGQGSERTPNGRSSVSAALAGIKGFALGVTNGIGGALLYDVATSNATLAYVINLLSNLNTNTIGSTGGGNTGGGGINNTVGTIQEVCFNSGSLVSENTEARNNDEQDNDNYDDDEDFYDDDDEEEEEEELVQGRQSNSPVYNGLTCIVVNTGEAIVRHRRSIEIVKDSTVAPTVLLVQDSTN
ncbi:hypothetical protein ACLKA6_002046 [Drosophila palustris]